MNKADRNLAIPVRSLMLAATLVCCQQASSSQVQIREAPKIKFPGVVDCNSPAHWSGDTLYAFNSEGNSYWTKGTDLLHLGAPVWCYYSNEVWGGRWIEATWKEKDGMLYGWYHMEPWGAKDAKGVCPERTRKPAYLTAPKIGAVRSSDDGAHWEDLGIILEAPEPLNCDTANHYFAGGNGDFSVMLDQRSKYMYFFIGTYHADPSEQGVAVARMRWKDRDHPVGKAWKWRKGRWSEPGLGGHVTPILPAKTDWHAENADAFWGPSIHWNTHLQGYVMLLNRTKDMAWTQEGIYISYASRLDAPESWTVPERILTTTGWYPQVIGIGETERYTDKLSGRTARLFVHGESNWEITFMKPGENVAE